MYFFCAPKLQIRYGQKHYIVACQILLFYLVSHKIQKEPESCDIGTIECSSGQAALTVSRWWSVY